MTTDEDASPMTLAEMEADVIASFADMLRIDYRLTAWQMEILEFERATWSKPGRRAEAVIERFGHNITRHIQVVHALITLPAAQAYDPQLVARLRRIQDARKAHRRGGTR